MKQKNTILSTLAPALLLLAATLCVAGCSQTDDAPADAALAARGGEPLHIRIAPKPGYTDADASTRSKVDGATGKFSWEEGDMVYYHITFNDAAGTIIKQTYRYEADGSWSQFAKWMGESAESVVWPMGASSAEVKACYSNSQITNPSDPNNTVSFADTQENGLGAHAVYSGTLSFGNVLDIKLKHATTRFEFTGLEPNTAYTIANATYFKQWHAKDGFQNGVDASFTTDASGNAITYGHIDSFAVDGAFNIVLQKAGTTVHSIGVQAQGTTADWKTDGYIYKVNVNKGGSVNPDNTEDLIAPSYKGKKPNLLAIPGKTAYWVAPENIKDGSGNDKAFTWSANLNDECPAGWHVPTQDDFVAMTGLSKDEVAASDIYTAMKAAFPIPSTGNGFWSSTEYDADTFSCYLYVSENNIKYSENVKIATGFVRCVRKK